MRDLGDRHVSQLNKDTGYELKNLRPGEYLAFAFEDMDYASLQDPDVLAAVASKATKVTLEPGEAKTVSLKILPWPEQFADRLQ